MHLALRLLSVLAAGVSAAAIDGDSSRAAAASKKLAPDWKDDDEADRLARGLPCATSCVKLRRCRAGWLCHCETRHCWPAADMGVCTAGCRCAVCIIVFLTLIQFGSACPPLTPPAG